MLTGDERTADLRTELRAGLGEAARAWLDDALAAAAEAAEAAAAEGTGEPADGGALPGPGTPGRTRRPIPAWELRFASAGRHLGRRPAGQDPVLAGTPTDRGSGSEGPNGPATGVPGEPATGVPGEPATGVPGEPATGVPGEPATEGPGEPATEGPGGQATEESPAAPAAVDPLDPVDAARVLLLHAARAGSDTVARLYAHGTAAERRAVLIALPRLPWLGAAAVPLLEDALRANDTRLVAAAVGPYAARHLDPHAWRHAVLKCLFTGVPVAAVAGLERRAEGDAELARMLTDYARERTAAGRPVPPDLDHALALTAETAGPAPSTGSDASAGSAPSTGPGNRPVRNAPPSSRPAPSAPTSSGARPVPNTPTGSGNRPGPGASVTPDIRRAHNTRPVRNIPPVPNAPTVPDSPPAPHAPPQPGNTPGTTPGTTAPGAHAGARRAPRPGPPVPPGTPPGAPPRTGNTAAPLQQEES